MNNGDDKPIRFSEHAKNQLSYRGVTADEVIETIQTTGWRHAEPGLSECSKEFIFDKIWNDKHYKTKKVKPIFEERQSEIVVVTVYTYYY